jgi:hypothetical protein
VANFQKAPDFGAHEFVDLDNDALQDVGGVDLVFDVIGGDIQKRSAGLVRAGGTLVSIVGRPRRGPPTAWRSTSLSSPIVPNWVRSSSACGTDDCGRASATSRPSTMPSPPSTRTSDARGRRSFAFVREDLGEGERAVLLSALIIVAFRIVTIVSTGRMPAVALRERLQPDRWV